jgi:TIR domain-containing protein/uncharacterized protein DUF2252
MIRPSVFVSYAQEDTSVARQTCVHLEAAGLKCWIAERDIPLSSQWSAAIALAIRRCQTMLVVFSEAANNSKQVPREVELADRANLPLVLFRVSDAEPSGSLAYFLGNLQWLDAFNGSLTDSCKRVVALVHGLTSQRISSQRLAPVAKQGSIRLANPFNHRRSSKVRNFCSSTHDYERWLSEHSEVVKQALQFKHSLLRRGIASFLAGTFYRWIELFPQVCPKVSDAPAVLAVGDATISHYGTWRDSHNRLVWGIEYFDEADVLPYTNDLVRLATSARAAVLEADQGPKLKRICRAILAGYHAGLHAGGRPFVLEEENLHLRDLIVDMLDPREFWERVWSYPKATASVPNEVRETIQRLAPEPSLNFTTLQTTAGLGSLGRERFVFLADWRGGNIGFYAKALAPPACAWVFRDGRRLSSLSRQALAQAVRSADPSIQFAGNWIVRRLSPWSSRLPWNSSIPKRRALDLLYGMAWEVANVHLGSKRAVTAVKDDLKARPSGWLREAVKEMLRVTHKDWGEWTKSG